MAYLLYFLPLALAYLMIGLTIYPLHQKSWGDFVLLWFIASTVYYLPWHYSSRALRGFIPELLWGITPFITVLIFAIIQTMPGMQVDLASLGTTTPSWIALIGLCVVGFVLMVYWVATPLYAGRPLRLLGFLATIGAHAGILVVAHAFANDSMHIHHWWVGFIGITLSTWCSSNTLDVVIQAIFWGILLDGMAQYQIIVNEFYLGR